MEIRKTIAGKVVCVGTPELFVDNQARKRSGHAGHAMTETADGKLMAFFSNHSPVRANGHACFGWTEYRFSGDRGSSWEEEIHTLDYSRAEFFGGVDTIVVEKAVTCRDGSILAFCMKNSTFAPICSEPWFVPTYLKSTDNGLTFGAARDFCLYRGRIYDAQVIGGDVYVLMFCNDGAVTFTGNRPDHVYRLYRSTDCGETFEEVSIVRMNAMGRAYGSMQMLADGRLAIYTYNVNNEYECDFVTSRDMGKTWERPGTCYLAKGIRNPQVGVVDGVFVLHGRGAHGKGFVFYFSSDGEHWDEGAYLETEKTMCYYSNNLPVRGTDGKNRLLVQFSEVYERACANVWHLWVSVEA